MQGQDSNLDIRLFQNIQMFIIVCSAKLFNKQCAYSSAFQLNNREIQFWQLNEQLAFRSSQFVAWI